VFESREVCQLFGYTFGTLVTAAGRGKMMQEVSTMLTARQSL
jgi:hypothetical protein